MNLRFPSNFRAPLFHASCADDGDATVSFPYGRVDGCALFGKSAAGGNFDLRGFCERWFWWGLPAMGQQHVAFLFARRGNPF